LFLILISFSVNQSFAQTPDNSPEAQPITCGQGTIEKDGICVPDPIDQEILLIIIGLVVTAIASGIGLFFTAMETRESRKEKNLSMVGSFTAQLSSLKDKERNLNTQKDCEIYALNFVDLMDQIAYLRIEKTIPDLVTKFFENDFAYALTMIEWLRENKIISDTSPERPGAVKLNQQDYFASLSVNDDNNDEFTWSSLIKLCREKIPSPIEPLEKNNLPPAMIKDFSSLPTEEIDTAIELVKGYSEQITNMKEKERGLKTKKDCEIYALNYVDLMDQIAFLYLKNMFPSDLAKYFENEFAYALTMIKWLNNNKIIDKYSEVSIGDGEKDWKNYFDSLEIDDIRGNEFTWSSLLGWCREKKSCIQPLEDVNLPPIMKEEFNSLPDESVETSLEIIKDYGERLSKITEKEKDFGESGFLECELYANSYLDLVDGIAFLYRQKVIPEQIAEYFENNFCYALTLYSWLLKQKLANPIKIRKKAVPGDKDEKNLEGWLKNTDSEIWEVDKDFTWTDLMTWCKTHSLDPFEDDQLPPIMRNMKIPEEFWLDIYKK
jgi:hypothetical protein